MQSMQLIALLTIVACAQSINIVGVESIDSIPKATYKTYTYVAPSAPQLRAVFLESPDSNVEIVPYSVQITSTASTPDEALAWLEKGPGFKRISFYRVDFRGKTIGYLLLPERHSFARRYIEVNLYERGGRIFFVPSEQGVND